MWNFQYMHAGCIKFLLLRENLFMFWDVTHQTKTKALIWKVFCSLPAPPLSPHSCTISPYCYKLCHQFYHCNPLYGLLPYVRTRLPPLHLAPCHDHCQTCLPLLLLTLVNLWSCFSQTTVCHLVARMLAVLLQMMEFCICFVFTFKAVIFW